MSCMSKSTVIKVLTQGGYSFTEQIMSSRVNAIVARKKNCSRKITFFFDNIGFLEGYQVEGAIYHKL